MSWLAKLRRYGGGESVMSRHATKHDAQLVVDEWNTQHQTDSAYVEQYDKSKDEGPTHAETRAIVDKMIARIRERNG